MVDKGRKALRDYGDDKRAFVNQIWTWVMEGLQPMTASDRPLWREWPKRVLALVAIIATGAVVILGMMGETAAILQNIWPKQNGARTISSDHTVAPHQEDGPGTPPAIVLAPEPIKLAFNEPLPTTVPYSSSGGCTGPMVIFDGKLFRTGNQQCSTLERAGLLAVIPTSGSWPIGQHQIRIAFKCNGVPSYDQTFSFWSGVQIDLANELPPVVERMNVPALANGALAMDPYRNCAVLTRSTTSPDVSPALQLPPLNLPPQYQVCVEYTIDEQHNGGIQVVLANGITVQIGDGRLSENTVKLRDQYLRRDGSPGGLKRRRGYIFRRRDTAPMMRGECIWISSTATSVVVSHKPYGGDQMFSVPLPIRDIKGTTPIAVRSLGSTVLLRSVSVLPDGYPR